MIILDKHLKINSVNFITIIKYLTKNGGVARLVGGIVRDSLLGIDSADIDIATSLTPQQVTKALRCHNIMVIYTGIRFGTVTAIINKESFEITTLREDIESNGRHSKVKYSKDFAVDAERRDFTINALSYCPIEHKIYDYFSGIKDLKDKKVIFIGNAEERLREDYLRILRFFRFSAKYASSVDETGLQACISLKSSMLNLSKERIKSEMDRLLMINNHYNMIKIMVEQHIITEVMPIKKYDFSLHLKAISICQNLKVVPTLHLLYAILFMHTENIDASSLVSLKFSKKEANIIVSMLKLTKLADYKSIVYYLKTFWQREDEYLTYFIFAMLLVKNSQDIIDLFLLLSKKEKPTFPLKGTDIKALGYQKKEIGDMLDYLRRKWVENNFEYSKDLLLTMHPDDKK